MDETNTKNSRCTWHCPDGEEYCACIDSGKWGTRKECDPTISSIWDIQEKMCQPGKYILYFIIILENECIENGIPFQTIKKYYVTRQIKKVDSLIVIQSSIVKECI